MVARVSRLAEIADIKIEEKEKSEFYQEVENHFDSFRVDLALEFIWQKISELDGVVNKNELWVNTKEKTNILNTLIKEIRKIAFNVKPFIPQAAEKIEKQFSGKIEKIKEPLFKRLP